MATAATEPVMKLTTSLGDGLRFRSLSASEQMARLFEFNVLAVGDQNVDPTALLGTNASVSIEVGQGQRRHFHGQVARAGLDSAIGRHFGWRLVLRPWLWQATRRTDSRIFQNLSVPDILKKVFDAYTGAVEYRLTATYAPRLYCVQYRETDFNFVSRLMEEEGIGYFFKHSADRHTLVICDAMTAHEEAPGFATVLYRDTQDQLLELKAITEWRHAHELSTGKVTLTDYDYLKPSTSLSTTVSTTQKTSKAALEHYDHPGLYTDKSRGTGLARVRQQELDARVLRISGHTTTVGGLAAGSRFKLQEHPIAAENVDHVIVGTRIEAQYAGYESGSGETRFSCRFEAMRYAHTFRPDRITPRPIVAGPQTAVVVGPSGEEIFTDEHGRIKVQFHWDRIGTKNENSSCWVRVATRWAGKAWGMISIPRIGQEVVVEFIEGDPDLPLVTGGVYNAEQVTPYKLPDHKTVSTIKSRSSKGGGNDNFNELAFEDLKGSEWVRLHAEKDLLEVVKNDAHRDVGRDQFLKIVNNLTEEIGANVDRKIKGDFTELIEKNARLEIKQSAKVKIGGALGLMSGGAMSIETGAAFSLKSKAAGDVKIGANLGVEGVNVHVKGSANVVVEAGAMLTLKGSMINIEASGIVSINGALVKINSGGGGGSGGGANPTSPDAPEAPQPIQPLKDKLDDVKGKLAQGR